MALEPIIQLDQSRRKGQPALADIERRSGQRVLSCYQCGNCSASCPAAFAMDYTPRQVMRALQLGLIEQLLESSAIWVCLSCQTCVVRCPRQLEPAKVMDALRQLAVEKKVRPRESAIFTFHESFIQLLKFGGRLYEVGLIGLMNLRTGRPLANVSLALPMLSKGKIALVPQRAKPATALRSVFEKTIDAPK